MTSPLKVSSYQELQDFIDALPPPREGLVRVYRGQDQPWPLLPSGRRRVVPRAEIWSHYLRRMVMLLEQSGVHDDLDREFQIWFVWLQALAQHYGAGSNYLDISHDLGVATWFAFHSSKSAKLETVVGPPDTNDQDAIEKTTWLRLFPQTGPGYVYVLDLKPWSGKGMPEAGELVDLHQAPEIFHSKRIEVQVGCLVLADEKQDLAKDYLVTETPIEMTTGFDQSPYASWTVENIFPPPAQDHWYARFLGMPFLLTPELGKEPTLQQSLPVMLFLSDRDGPYVNDIRSRFRHLLPAHIYSSLPAERDDDGQWWSNFTSDKATVIALEGPQISAHPSVEDGSWNHELLLTDLAIDANIFEIGNSQSAGKLVLDNVMLEFSALETHWDLGQQGQLLRALWFVRGPNDEIASYLILQDYPGFNVARAGPVLLRIGPASRRLEWKAPRQNRWSDITQLEGTGKAVVSGLVLMRDLSATPKLAAYPALVTDAGSAEGTALISISSAPARLFRATTSNSPRPWYVLRHQDGEPYTIAKPNVGTLSIRGATPFAKMSAKELKRLLTEQLENIS